MGNERKKVEEKMDVQGFQGFHPGISLNLEIEMGVQESRNPMGVHMSPHIHI
jgi:hypothetical protein